MLGLGLALLVLVVLFGSLALFVADTFMIAVALVLLAGIAAGTFSAVHPRRHA
jgi:hypothetical protein